MSLKNWFSNIWNAQAVARRIKDLEVALKAKNKKIDELVDQRDYYKQECKILVKAVDRPHFPRDRFAAKIDARMPVSVFGEPVVNLRLDLTNVQRGYSVDLQMISRASLPVSREMAIDIALEMLEGVEQELGEQIYTQLKKLGNRQ